MNRDAVLSSEQALDDYFAALLDEELVELDSVQEKPPILAPQMSQESHAAPQLQEQLAPSYMAPEPVEPSNFPNLEDVQRLLSQLETTNPVDNIDDINVEALLEKNTDKIAARTVETDVSIQVTDEIQEWDISPESDDLESIALETVDESTIFESNTLVSGNVELNSLEQRLSEPVVQESIVQESIVQESVAERVEEPQIDQEVFEAQTVEDESATLETQIGGDHKLSWHNIARKDSFQILYFEVNGVMFAVPLDELGGIHRLETLNHLIGRPQWYLGLQTNRNSQLDVVDTARWVMADKLRDDSYKSEYQYIVMLGDSMWGLASDELKGTELLNYEKVRWREKAGKRPWLAGMVKERMCALIHVKALIEMLNAGLDVKALDN